MLFAQKEEEEEEEEEEDAPRPAKECNESCDMFINGHPKTRKIFFFKKKKNRATTMNCLQRKELFLPRFFSHEKK